MMLIIKSLHLINLHFWTYLYSQATWIIQIDALTDWALYYGVLG